jgi:heme/copper-type cytochrome/quinol oxidase subunit 2
MALIGLAVAVIAIAIVITVSSSSTSKKQSTSQTAAPPVVVVRGANPVGGIKKLTFNKGDRARFVIDSDVADEVHVHGYDFKRDVKPGHPIKFDFPATKDGIFDIELEGRGRQIASLQVQP